MPEEPLPIDSFPDTAAAASGAVVRANRALAVASIDRSLRGGVFNDVLFLRRASFQWRFYLARRDDEVIFFFFRSSSPAKVILDATAAFSFTPQPPDAVPLPVGPLSYRWVLPPFIIWAPRAEEVQLWGPCGAATAENTIFLALGPSRERVLAVHFPASGTVRLSYSAEGGKVIFGAQAGRWPLRPLLDLLVARGDWAEADPERGTEVPLAPTGAAARSDVARILVALAEGWNGAAVGGRLRSEERQELISSLLVSYAIDDLRARVLLRLSVDGDLAEEDEDDPLQLALTVRVGARDAQVVATAAINPPDFLVQGALHQAFGELVASERVVGVLHAALANPELSVEALSRFLLPSRSRWTVFRVARRQTHDTDAVVWEGQSNGRPHLLIFRANFVVDASGAAPSVQLADAPDVQARWTPADVSEIDVLKEDVGYLIRLLREVHRWREVIA